MADTKISALTAASAALGADELAINEAGTSKKLTVALIQTLIGGGIVLFVAATDASAKEKRAADYQCDGTADNVQIQAALDAITAAGGGIVQLSSGTFTLAGNTPASAGGVRVDDNTALIGAGMGATIITLVAGFNAGLTGLVRVPNGGGVHNVRIADLTVDGNKANQTAGNLIFGFYCGDATTPDEDITCERVEIRNCMGYGFDPHEQTLRLRLMDCHSHDNDLDGFTLDFMTDAVVMGCLSYSNARHGFNIISGTRQSIFVGCTARDNAENGFTFQNSATRCSVIGAIIHGNLAGVLISNVADISIMDSTIYLNVNAGIDLYAATRAVVTGNRIFDNSQGTAGSYPAITVKDNTTTGSTRCLIAGNHISGTSHSYGIREDATLQADNTIGTNHIYGAATADVLISSLTTHRTPSGIPLGQPSPLKSGIYGWLGSKTSSSATVTNNSMRAAPVYFEKAVTLDRIGVRVATVGEAGSVIRLGVYRDSGDNYPLTLLLDAGTVAGDATGAQEATISFSLAPGTYWFVAGAQSSPTTPPIVNTVSESQFVPGSPDNTSGNSSILCYTHGGVTGALPGTWSTTVSVSSAMPRIFWRVA